MSKFDHLDQKFGAGLFQFSLIASVQDVHVEFVWDCKIDHGIEGKSEINHNSSTLWTNPKYIIIMQSIG